MSDVTRSYDATSTPAAHAVERRRRTQPNGWWGGALFIATEATLFGTLIASYFYLRFQVVNWPPPGIEPPSVTLPLILTGALVATSAPIFLAVRLGRRARLGPAIGLLGAALLVQGGYLAVQIVLYLEDLAKFSPQDSAYGSVYFTLLMLHHVHVAVGMVLSLWIAGRLLFGLTAYRATSLRVVGMYWHFVNVMAVLVVLTQISPSL